MPVQDFSFMLTVNNNIIAISKLLEKFNYAHLTILWIFEAPKEWMMKNGIV
jgi:hypothetical protein